MGRGGGEGQEWWPGGCGKGEVVCQTGTVCYVRGMRPEGQQIWDENKALHA